MSAAINSKKELTVVVVAGAGARGAYEAGAMAEVLPELLPEGLASTIFLGTSAGAINAALWAAKAGRNKRLRSVGDEVKKTWTEIHRPDVFNLATCDAAKLGFEVGTEIGHVGFSNTVGLVSGTVNSWFGWIPGVSAVIGLGKQATDAVGSGVANVVGSPVAGTLSNTPGVFDTSPLRETAKAKIDFPALNANINDGVVGGVGLVATSCPLDASGGRSRIFLKTKVAPIPQTADGGSIDYVPTDVLKVEHMLASAAIPVAFPPVWIEQPPIAAPGGASIDYSGWYTDGGVRLNAPIEPAIRLGATRIIVISSHAASYPANTSAGKAQRPGLLDVSAQSLHAVLADGMIEDLRTLERTNGMVEQAAQSKVTLLKKKNLPYRKIEIYVVAPQNGVLSPLALQAEAMVAARAQLLDMTLSRLLTLAGSGGSRNELLSYLLFEPEFFQLQFDQAMSDAQRALKGWRDAAAEAAQ